MPTLHRRPPVVVVTSAAPSHADDLRLRLRRYALTQAARIACFVLAVSLPVPLGWRLALIGGAVALPWMGVVAANAGPAVSRTGRVAGGAPLPQVPGPAAIAAGRVIDQD